MDIQPHAKRNFLTLLVAYFAIGTVFHVIFLLEKCAWIPKTTLSDFLVSISSIILYIIVLLRLLVRKEYGLTKGSRFGIILLMIQQCQGFTAGAIFEHYPEAYLQLSLLHAAFTVIYIVGIIMFIHGSPADRNLKKFVKWTPFINMIATIFLSSASVIADKTQIMSSPGYHIIFTTINLAVFLTVYHMARRSILSATTGS